VLSFAKPIQGRAGVVSVDCVARVERAKMSYWVVHFFICNHCNKSNSTMTDDSRRDDIIQAIMGENVEKNCNVRHVIAFFTRGRRQIQKSEGLVSNQSFVKS
jgi:hypothetical protein